MLRPTAHRRVVLAVLFVASTLVLYAALRSGVDVGDERAPRLERNAIPPDLRLENLPDRVGVASADGTLAGYVDKHLLLAVTRDLTVPDGYDIRGPFPVYDEQGEIIGTYHHDLGFEGLDDEAPGAGHSPVTTTSGGSRPP